MDNNYSHLVSSIQKVEALVDAVQKLSKNSELNLVTSDWLNRLENNIAFQDYKFRPNSQRTSITTHYDWEASKDPPFNVIVAGIGRFAKPYNVKDNRSYIIINNSEPLYRIAQCMTKDLGEINISNEFKFSLKECGPLGCNICNSANKAFVEMGFKLNKSNQACIADTKIFDGKKVINRFQSQMEELFKQSNFITIVRLEISTRYSYFDKVTNSKIYKIGGDLTDIIAIQESKLNASKTINLGELTPIKPCEKLDELISLIPEEYNESESPETEYLEEFPQPPEKEYLEEFPQPPEKEYLEELARPDIRVDNGPSPKKVKVEQFSFMM